MGMPTDGNFDSVCKFYQDNFKCYPSCICNDDHGKAAYDAAEKSANKVLKGWTAPRRARSSAAPLPGCAPAPSPRFWLPHSRSSRGTKCHKHHFLKKLKEM